MAPESHIFLDMVAIGLAIVVGWTIVSALYTWAFVVIMEWAARKYRAWRLAKR